MNVLHGWIQAAAEYGAAAGGGAGSVRSASPTQWLDQGFAVVADNPGVLVVALVSLFLLVGLLRTRGYRS